MSLGLLGGYGSDSASGSEISDSDGEAPHKEVVEPAPGSAGSESGDASCAQSQDKACGEHLTAVGGGGEREGACEQPQTVGYYGLGTSDSLLGCVDSDSSSKSADEAEEGGEGFADDDRDHSPLPLPDLDGSKKIVSSVFSNPYMEAEEARLAVLKQHVDLSPSRRPAKIAGSVRGGPNVEEAIHPMEQKAHHLGAEEESGLMRRTQAQGGREVESTGVGSQRL